jgi:hypothetical protein
MGTSWVSVYWILRLAASLREAPPWSQPDRHMEEKREREMPRTGE